MVTSAIFSQGPSVAATLLQIFEEQYDAECAEVLRSAVATITLSGWDGWNDETAIYQLMLAVPPSVFARLEKQLEKIEKRIDTKIARLHLGVDKEQLRSSSVCPALLAGPGVGASAAPSETDAVRIWGSGRVRMFLSHVSAHRAAASKIKAALIPMGIASFIAHEDIEPSLEWQKEIELALQSMDVLCALITPDFTKSKWTDQEVGYALGRKVRIVPVRLQADPYGFIGRLQAVTGTLQKPEDIVIGIFDAIMRIDPLRSRVVDALVGTVAEADSFFDAIKGVKTLSAHQSALNGSHIERLLRAARDNSQVKGAFGVVDQIHKIARKAWITPPNKASDAAADDDIPF